MYIKFNIMVELCEIIYNEFSKYILRNGTYTCEDSNDLILNYEDELSTIISNELDDYCDISISEELKLKVINEVMDHLTTNYDFDVLNESLLKEELKSNRFRLNYIDNQIMDIL